MATLRIRTPAADELPDLQRIERAAGAVFRTVGLAAVADDEPPPIACLEACRLAGRAWVADGPTGKPIGYLLALVVDGDLHVEQVSVAPAHARRGVGAQLIEHLAAQAREAGGERVTLNTFRDVPWNAPYYGRLGFRVLPLADCGRELRALIDAEARALPVAAPRVAMARRV